MAEQVDNIQRRAGTLSQEIDKANSIVQDIAKQASHSPMVNHIPSSVDASQQSQTTHETFSAQQFLPPRSSSSRSTTSLSSRSTQLPRSPTLNQDRGVPSPRSPDLASIHLIDLDGRQSSNSYPSSDSELDAELEDLNPSRLAYLSQHEIANHTSSARDPDPRTSQSRPDSYVLSPRLAPSTVTSELPPPLEEVEKAMSNLNIHPAIRDDVSHRHRSSTTTSQRKLFEKAAFANSAILCDV